MANKVKKSKKRKSLIKVRIPVPPPNKVFKSKKDYSRKKEKLALNKLVTQDD